MTPRHRRLFAGLFAAGIALATAKKAASLSSPDFRVFFVAARHALSDPENIYRLSPDRFLYPPAAALLLTPFAFTENFALHQWLWHGFLALLLAALAAESWAALAALVLLTRYLAISFSYGQINLLLLGLLAACGLLISRGRFHGAGAFWALAAGLKVYPAVLAPAFFPAARWRAFGGAALTAGFLFFLPFVAFGLETAWTLYGEFFRALQAKGLPTHSHNQSFSALLLRIFTPQEFYLHAVGPAWWGLADLPVAWLRVAALGLGLLAAGTGWVRAWRCGLAATPCLSAASFSVLFLSHIVWKDYFLLLFFPLRELLRRLPRRKAWLLSGLFALAVTLSSPDLVGHVWSTRLDAACIHLWCAVLVWVAWWRS